MDLEQRQLLNELVNELINIKYLGNYSFPNHGEKTDYVDIGNIKIIVNKFKYQNEFDDDITNIILTLVNHDFEYIYGGSYIKKSRLMKLLKPLIIYKFT